MASESETVIGVLAEWRDCIESADPSVWNDERIAGLVKITKAQQLAYLARIEAAWRREKSEIEADALAVGGIVGAARHSPGNAAAMREALVKTLDAIKSLSRTHNDDLPEDVCAILGRMAFEANEALSAPARQCDVGTPEEQSERMEKAVCSKHYGCVRCPLRKAKYSDCSLKWAQMPYEAQEGAVK